MKKALLPLLLIIALFGISLNETNAQICTPDGAYTLPGIWPDSIEGIDTATQCSPYSQVLTIIVPIDTVVQGQALWIDSIVLTGIDGLPAGLSYACEPPSCGLVGGTTGCVLISGTPLETGVFSLDAYTTSYVTLKAFAFSTTQDDTIKYYDLVVDTTLFLSSSVSNASCVGVCDGSIMVTPTGGSGPYTYAWNDPGSQTSQTAVGLCAGVYAVTVTAASGCYSVDIVTVTNTSFLATTVVTTDETCGSANGTATATTTGGTSAYTYSWSSGDTLNVASGLAGGSYTVSVIDANGCTDNGAGTVNSIAPMTYTSTATFSSCGNADGSVTVNMSGGTTPYTYLWGDPGTQTTSTATGLASGAYMLIVTDGLGCIDTINTTVSDAGGLTISMGATTMITCNGDCDGDATVIAAGVLGTVTYSWNTSPVQTTAMATSLCAATHTVTATDSLCTTSLTVTITEPSVLIISSDTAMNSSCNGAGDEGIVITASGGTGTLTYSIDSGSTYVGSGTFTGTGAGTFNVMVMDASGCTEVGSVLTIIEPAAVVINNEASVDVACNGMMDGSITITASGGVAPLSYSLDGGTSYSNTTGSFTGLGAGTSNIAVQDANMCQVVGGTIVISEPSVLTSSPSSTMESGIGIGDGTASTAASGGTGAYTYSWNTTPIQNTTTATGLSTGDYVVNITDANGCTLVDSVTVGLGIGIQDLTNNLIVSLYPNPAQNELTIELNLNYDFTIIAYDIRGQQVLTKAMTGGKNVIPLANLSTGLYVYHIFDTSGAALSHGKFNILK